MFSLHAIENQVSSQAKKHDEKQLARRIAIFLATRGDVGGGRIAIDVVDGLVTLSGVVSTLRQKQQIEFYCQHVAGVFGVTNGLEVDDRPRLRGDHSDLHVASGSVAEPATRHLPTAALSVPADQCGPHATVRERFSENTWN